jgi:signal transduction histidine kinase
LSKGISRQVERSNVVIDMMLASARMEQIESSTFARHSMATCVADALASYPFAGDERTRVSLGVHGDYEFHGSDSLMVYVLFNLIKNSLYAIKAAGKGTIEIEVKAGERVQTLTFTDTGSGIPASALPRIFDTFFTTKHSAGAGIGLAFCHRAIASFGGSLRCESVERHHTTFTMEFPPLERNALRPGCDLARPSFS